MAESDLAADQEYYEQTHRPRRKDTPREWRLHAAAAKLCYRRERTDPTFRFFSPGGEGARTPQRAAIAKMMGQNRSGVPDLWMLRPGKLCVVEFKLPGKYPTAEQKDWLAWAADAAIGAHVVHTLEEFRLILDRF